MVLRGPITVNGENYNSIMVSQGLDDEEISDVVNYILNSWETLQRINYRRNCYLY